MLRIHSHLTALVPLLTVTLGAFGLAGAAAVNATPPQIKVEGPRKADMILGSGPFGHAHGIHAIAYSPDGKLLATSSGRALIHQGNLFRITLWDAASGRALLQLNADDNPAHQLAFSPDSKLLFSGPRYIPAVSIADRFVRVWDLATGRQTHKVPAVRWALSPDGKTLATATLDPTDVNPAPQPEDPRERLPSRYLIKLFDPKLWKEVPQFRETMRWLVAMTFSPDGRTLACGSAQDGSIELWDVVRFKKLPRLVGPEGTVHLLAFSPDGKTLASSGEMWTRPDATVPVVLWDWAAGKRRHRIEAHTERIGGIAFTPDGKHLLSGSFDGSCRLWDVATGRPAGEPLRERRWCIGYLSPSPDGKTVALVGNLDGMLLRPRLIDLASRREILPPGK
jgi:WD40 repeat protein